MASCLTHTSVGEPQGGVGVLVIEWDFQKGATCHI